MKNQSPKVMFSRSTLSRRFFSIPLALLVISPFLNGQVGSPTQSQSPQQPQLGRTTLPTQQPSTPPALTVAPEGVSKMKLAPGTVVNVHIFEETDLDGTYRVDDQGNISLPLAGTVYLADLTLRQAEAAVSKKLISAQILNDPHVVVNLDEYSAENVVVTGQVTSPGRFPILSPRKLADVLAMAGGETTLAGNEIVIHRFGQPSSITESIHYGPETNDANALSVAINPGDNVLVERAGVVYVLGSVNRPGGYVMQEAGQLNLAEAMALAYGTAPEASLGRIRVIRKTPDGRFAQIPAQYDKFKKGQAAPMVLHAEDIVFVPSNAFKVALLDTKTELGAAGAATIYAFH